MNAIDVCITNYNPDVIFTHHPFDTHQAHAGVSNATIAAARRRNTVFFYEPITPSGRSYVAFKPDLYVDIEDTLEKKLNSLRDISPNIISSQERIGLKASDADAALEAMKLERSLPKRLRFLELRWTLVGAQN